MPSESTGHTSKLLEIKARLLESGEIFIPKTLEMPCFPSRSTAGPDAGMRCYTFDLGGPRVKLEVTEDSGHRFHLSEYNGGLAIFDGIDMLVEVHVLPTLAHAPNQAFVNLADSCIHKCSFCVIPHSENQIIKDMGPERVLRIIRIAANHPGFEAVALTSGVKGTETETNRQMAGVVKAVKESYPEIPIGVEAYFIDLDEIGMMRDSGADEIKINIEAWPPELFSKVCPTRDLDVIFEGLQTAVEVFGKGKVASNIIVGLGEADEDVESGVRKLVEMGVIPNIRAVRINDINRAPLETSLGKALDGMDAARLIRLAKMHKNILEEHGLSPLDFKTMCHSCQCCDIVPMRDF